MNIYFSGIGGVGVGPLAEIARDAGHTVTGSDVNESLMTTELEDSGVGISYNQNGSFLQEAHAKTPIDWFVYTAALPPNHPELLAAQRLGIKTSKRDELLAHIIAEKDLKLIAVSGTHGKTTATGMLIWTARQLGVPISYSLGTTINYGKSGKYDPTSQYFIYECDEFDRNFLHFHPYLSLITSIDYDHPDTYASEDDYKAAFRQFIDQSDQTILWQNDADYIQDSSVDTQHLQLQDTKSLNLPGEHNRRNATVVLKALEYLGIGNSQQNTQAIETFPGTDRRFEKLTDNLYSDYGHHPNEIQATLQMASEISKGVVLVYQPHQNIRQHDLVNDYTEEVFKEADAVYWLPTYLTREDPDLDTLSPEQLTRNIQQDKVRHAVLDGKLWRELQAHLDQGHLVLCMGAGTIDTWVREQF